MVIRSHNFILAIPLLICVVFLSACATSVANKASQPTLQQQEEVSEYRRLLAQAKQLSFTLDFDQLRRAFAESAEYNPYGGERLEGLAEAYTAVENGKYKECLEHVDRVLADNYMSLEAHMIGVVCSSRIGDYESEDRHRYMTEGLMDSIERSGDGRSQDTAYHTISASELRGFVRLKGFQVLDQSIVYDRRGIFDKIQVRDPRSGEAYALYFNISRQFMHSMENAAE